MKFVLQFIFFYSQASFKVPISPKIFRSPWFNSLAALAHSEEVYLLRVGILILFSSFVVFCCYLCRRSLSVHGSHLLTYSSDKVLFVITIMITSKSESKECSLMLLRTETLFSSSLPSSSSRQFRYHYHRSCRHRFHFSRNRNSSFFSSVRTKVVCESLLKTF